MVLGIDGQRIGDSADLPRLIGEKRPGTRVRMEIWRDGRSRELVATLDELTPQAGAATPAATAGEGAIAELGVNLRPLQAQEASRLGIAGGLVVEAVSGAAQNAGLQRGDVVLALNNQAVSSVEQFRERLSRAGKRFALLIQRGNTRIFVPIRLD